MRNLIPVLWMMLIFAPSLGAEPANTSCVSCHSDPELFEEPSSSIVSIFEKDVHSEVGVSCHGCHGGNPSLDLADDMDAAMDPEFALSPFRGTPDRGTIPEFCGRCHSDPIYMKRFQPDLRVDQESQYWMSPHGKALATGDDHVATCINCHSVHGILRTKNPDSPVYPTHVAETCGHCHGDSEYMEGYKLPGGQPLPVDQVARWKQSVHANALFEKEDLSAPTCNDCHGSHGPAPPGVEDVAFVCGQCHGREAEIFVESPKNALFHEHNELLKESEGLGCRECHVAPEPQVNITGLHAFTQCATCHGNHAVMRPTIALFGLLPDIPCVFCHEPGGPLDEELPESKVVREHYEQLRNQLLVEADTLGLSGNDLFDWMVDRALTLPTHTTKPSGSEGEEIVLRPEFARLFAKFRIGKVHYTYTDAGTGKQVHVKTRQCSDCHGSNPQLGDEAIGYKTTRTFLDRMQELTGLTARAERVLLTAQRGGVEVREAQARLEKAVDSQIQLEVLVHTFSIADSGSFLLKQAEGVEHATASFMAGQQALKELSNRRTGLLVALVVIILTLVGLGLKIRHVSSKSSV